MNVRAHVQSLIMGVVVGCLSLSGCQFAPKSKSWSWPWSKKSDESKLPDRMLPIWTDTVLHQPNQPGLRGFGGRLFFYREGNPEPIEVEGGLAVYVFDADKLSPQQPNPEKKFVFTAEQFASHMSQSSMGPSYSVWLPWDEVGGPNRKLSLVARFEGSNGGTVISEPTIKLLPGVGSASTESNNLANDSKGFNRHRTSSLLTTHSGPNRRIEKRVARRWRRSNYRQAFSGIGNRRAYHLQTHPCEARSCLAIVKRNLAPRPTHHKNGSKPDRNLL